MSRNNLLVLVSMDGVGVAPPSEGNAVTLADTPNLDSFWPKYPHTYLEASGLQVGLPSGTDGNSEVGHMAMGAGKVIFQNLPRIDNSIKNESFYLNESIKGAFDHAKKNNSNVHIMGITGDGVVHGSVEHLFAIIEFAVKQKFPSNKLFLHAFSDGRDSAPSSGIKTLQRVELFMSQQKMGKLVSIIGRAYAMDRNRNWERTKKAYDALVNGVSNMTKSWQKTMEDFYKKDILDEYMEPISVLVNDKPVLIQQNDAIIFFNFRPDRAVQLTMAFEADNFSGWERKKIENLYFVGMTDYEDGYPKIQAFPPEEIEDTLGKVLARNGLKQLRIAESEKFPHVTYFFNGGKPDTQVGEKWIEVPSPSVETYDLQPHMSQEWVTKKMIEELESGEYDFALINFAGPDMVGHTGNIQATISAMENADKCIGIIANYVLSKNGTLIITADHGNAEEMIDLKTGEVDTKHSTNQVPLIIIGRSLQGRELAIGTLADIAPTIISLYGLEIPPTMTGRNLLI